MVRTASLAANPGRGGGNCEFSTPLANGELWTVALATFRPRSVLFGASDDAGAARPHTSAAREAKRRVCHRDTDHAAGNTEEEEARQLERRHGKPSLGPRLARQQTRGVPARMFWPSINLGAAPPSCFDVQARAGAREFIYTDRDHCVTVQGRTILTYSTRQPTVAFFNAWSRALQQLVDADTTQVAAITVIDSSGARPPDDASRKAIRQAFARHSAKICAFAYVVEGEGFAAATIRAAVSLITMAEHHPFPLRVFATISDAATWVLPRLPEHAAHDDRSLVALVDGMRRQTKQGVTAG